MRVYTPDMNEISGFGGGYEMCCRAMVLAGLEWLDEHQDADLRFSTFKNIYGIINEETPEAREMVREMVKVAEPLGGATGAMVQATVGHVMHIREVGWEKYVTEMEEKADES